MSRYRTNSIAELARQMVFVPLRTRAAQVTSAERLLHDIEPNKAYPLELVIFRITGYRPKRNPGDLLTGVALQHDLGLLVEQISLSLNQRVDELAEPVLSIEEVSEKFNVTSKTIQRWRRRGLAGRRVIFADGKRRVGFLLSSVECFLSRQGRQVLAGVNFAPIDTAEQMRIARHARRLAVDGRCSPSEIGRRVGRKLHRSPLAILQTIKAHDQTHPQAAIQPQATAEISPENCARIRRRFQKGQSLGQLARKLNLTRMQIYHAIVSDRLARILKKKAKFIDDPLYHQADAARAIQAIVDQQPLIDPTPAGQQAPSRRIRGPLESICAHQVLTVPQERALFLKLNFHKYQFARARRRLDEQSAGHRELSQIEQHLHDVSQVRNRIVAANLRLVVSVARRHVRGEIELMDLISDGSLILLRAADSFDIHKGNRFSTYATFALMKGFARGVGRRIAKDRQYCELATDIADPAGDQPAQIMVQHDQLNRLMSMLAEPERAVVRAHFGLGEAPREATYQQISQRLGISLRQVHRLEAVAIAKMRAGAGEC